MRLHSQQTDRAVGALLGAAVGDALGVPYEFGSRPLDPVPAMHGGGLGGSAPGEWSDDTAMAVAIAEVAATGADVRTPESLDAVAAGFLRWHDDDPPDIGVQTRRVLGETRRRFRNGGPGGVAATMRDVAAELHARTGRTAGNGSLMRTAPVALASLGDPDAITAAARAVSALTHADPVAGDACVLWCLAVDLAVRTGRLDVRTGLDRVDPMWGPLLDEAERVEPSHYAASNGWVVAALCAAWSAVSRATSYEDGVARAVGGGGDTDTVAAIAGALLGAAYGGSAVPARWRRPLHGWPGLRARDLVRLAVLTVRGGRPDRAGWPSGAVVAYPRSSAALVPHPDDPGVLLGGVGALRPGVADAVVSLCRLGTSQVPATADPRDHVEFWLVDDEDANLDPAGVLLDAAETVRQLRAEGKTVLVHCVHAHTRTPLVAAAYGALVTGSSAAAALERVTAALPSARPRPSLTVALLERLEPRRAPELSAATPHRRTGEDAGPSRPRSGMSLSIPDLAARQLADYRAGTPGTWFAEHEGAELTLDDAYAIQDAVAALRSGDVVVGYKVGCTGPGTRAQFGLDGPIRGTLFGSELHRSGVSLSAGAFAGLAVEGELAVRIGPDGEPESVLPVVELHNYVFRGRPPTLQELVANNGIHAGVVLPVGEGVPWPRDGELTGVLRVEVDGVLVDEGPMSGVPGGPSGSLAWLRRHLEGRGRELRPGHLVLTGTPLGLIRVAAGDQVRVEAEGLGDVRAAVLP